MKTKIPAAMLGRSLQVAAFLNLPAADTGHADTGDAVIVSAIDAVDGALLDAPLTIELGEIAETNAPATFPVQIEWDAAAARRFKQLAEREALGIASSDEISELENLSGMRRRVEAPRSGEDVLREYEQGQLVRNLLQSLKRYVEFEQGTGTPKASTPRRRSKAAA